jgi:hypothetical protein
MCSQGKDGIFTGIDVRPSPGLKRWSLNATGIVVKKNGYMVSMRGHVLMKLNGKEVCNSRAMYGGPGHTTAAPDGTTWETINEMTNCHYSTKVVKGDKISVEASYDLVKHPSWVYSIPPIVLIVFSRLFASGGGHGGHGNIVKAPMRFAPLDGGEAEQMALFGVYFADEPPAI